MTGKPACPARFGVLFHFPASAYADLTQHAHRPRWFERGRPKIDSRHGPCLAPIDVRIEPTPARLVGPESGSGEAYGMVMAPAGANRTFESNAPAPDSCVPESGKREVEGMVAAQAPSRGVLRSC